MLQRHILYVGNPNLYVAKTKFICCKDKIVYVAKTKCICYTDKFICYREKYVCYTDKIYVL